MKRRRRLLVCLALLLVAVASLLHPAVHWRVIGWYRSEAFYQNRPTSWWAAECQQWEYRKMVEVVGSCIGFSKWCRQPTWLERLGLATPPDMMPLLNGDPAAFAVLNELAATDDQQVLYVTGYGIARVVE